MTVLYVYVVIPTVVAYVVLVLRMLVILVCSHVVSTNRPVTLFVVCVTSIQTALSAPDEVTAISFQVVPLIRRLVAVLSLQIVGFDPRPIHVEILLDNVARKLGFLRTLPFPFHRSTNALYSFIDLSPTVFEVSN